MTEEETQNLAAVRAYFETIGSDGPPAALGSFYAPDVLQEEFPNRFLPHGAERGLEELQAAGERGRKAMASQTFTVRRMLARDSTVVVEAEWTGTLSITLAEDLPAGTVMRARFAQFFELREGKILRQRNYDCFYPW
jgi:ketosteroid isomerase-like protein